MNVLLVHNFYQQPGGEDQTFADEGNLLEQHGNKVTRFTMHNQAVDSMGRLELVKKTLWNEEARRALRQAAADSKAEVVHFHNTFPLISPAAYYGAHDAGAAVVQTLHNYRLLCVAATFCRNDRVCEDCLGRTFSWPGIVHKCYRENRSASAMVAALQTFHRWKGTWQREVDAYITLSEFGRRKFIEGGLPAERLLIKPIYSDPDPGVGGGRGDFAVFVGRLTVEKGVRFLLEAWPAVFAATGVPLKIIGGGPLKEEAAAKSDKTKGLEFLGRLESQQDVYDTIGEARAMVFPSLWYEGQPRTIVESLAKGTPLLSSRLGSMPEMIQDGVTGRLFTAGDAGDLLAQARLLFDRNADPARMRLQARAAYESTFTAARNYPLLMRCYEQALEIHRAHRR